ncbi:MAG: YihY/virulence factor BrkB family protein [Geminicoccaceae bacterium]|nr:YihY/virulence factor BrkB family protein [Geminicoccaceae bacterium]
MARKENDGNGTIARLRSGFLRWLDKVPLAKRVVAASRRYILHQSANNSGHVAFSAVVAVFPLLLFISATASFVGEPGATMELARNLLDYVPGAVAQTLEPVVEEVLGSRHPGILTVGIVGTLWAGSSGLQATRMALNRAYGVGRGLSFWQARLKVTVLTIVGTVLAVTAFSSAVVWPSVDRIADALSDEPTTFSWTLWALRYGIAFTVLVILYAVLYAFLPDRRQTWKSVLPGAFYGAVAWLAAASVLSYTLSNVGKLQPVYGGFAGVVATLVFFYISAATLILGAEFNADIAGVPEPYPDDDDNPNRKS